MNNGLRERKHIEELTFKQQNKIETKGTSKENDKYFLGKTGMMAFKLFVAMPFTSLQIKKSPFCLQIIGLQNYKT